LLTLGGPKDQWDDFGRLGLGAEHVPELIRMATDAALNETGEEPICWAPIHACRVLAQLRAEEAIEPLVNLLEEQEEDDWMREELPECLAAIGPAALATLGRFLADGRHRAFPRIGASQGIRKIGQRHPDRRGECVRMLAGQLEKHEENDPTLNAFLIDDLAELHAKETLPLVQRAFEADSVDEMVGGGFSEVRKRFT
jgi:HEAT repeat protein